MTESVASDVNVEYCLMNGLTLRIPTRRMRARIFVLFPQRRKLAVKTRAM